MDDFLSLYSLRDVRLATLCKQPYRLSTTKL